MDTMYLDELVKLSDSADKIVAEVRNANAKLRCEYERKEAVALDKFINDMRKIAKYACKLNFRTYYTGITLDFENKSYHGSGCPEIVVSFYDDMFEILATPSGYSYKPTIYNDKFANYNEITNVHTLRQPQRFINGWSWRTEKCKRFIALNADKIYNRVYDMICERFAEETKCKVAGIRKSSERLIEDIERLDA